MGSRGRSIRLRIYFLVAIPLVAMIGLLAYVAGTSVNNAINLDRAPGPDQRDLTAHRQVHHGSCRTSGPPR